MVERWFPDADTNTVLLMLEGEEDSHAQATNDIRFIRLRRPLAQLIPDPSSPERRGQIEELLELMLTAKVTEDDPRMQVNIIKQGTDGVLIIESSDGEDGFLEEDEE